MRLIDADALGDKVADLYTEGEEATEADKVVNDVIDLIDNAPTVEITEEQAIDKLHETGWLPLHDKEMTERPKGKWIPQTDYDGFTYWKCSKCGKKNDYEITDFCFRCGADMRKEAEANDK